jgi:hypothetical protein
MSKMGQTGVNWPKPVDLDEEMPDKSHESESEEVDDMQEYVSTFVNNELVKALAPLNKELQSNKDKRNAL